MDTERVKLSETEQIFNTIIYAIASTDTAEEAIKLLVNGKEELLKSGLIQINLEKADKELDKLKEENFDIKFPKKGIYFPGVFDVVTRKFEE
jgi:hypothetical protein